MNLKCAVCSGLVLAGSLSVCIAQTEWTVDAGPLLDPGPSGSFDAGGSWPGGVVFDGAVFHMFYVGFPVVDGPFFTGWQIGHATSSDGLSWSKDAANPVVAVGAPGEWDEVSLSKPAVLFDGEQFHMWYVGGNSSLAAAGYATSSDGSAWTKYGDNPVMRPDSPESWEGASVAPHTVIQRNGSYQMWYYGGPPQRPFQIGYAESSDGISWSKNPGPVISTTTVGGWGIDPHEPAVLFDGVWYHMWYTASDGSAFQINYARSEDGRNWVRHIGNPVLTYEPHAISSRVVQDNGTYRMWFGSDSQIYHATSTGGEFMGSRRFIPAAAYAEGAEGSFFQTDVDLSNTDSEAVSYRFLWLPRGQSNREPLGSGIFFLAPGTSIRYANVLYELFDLAEPALGALAIEAASPELLIMSRTYSSASDGAAGSFGQAMPSISESEMIGPNERRRIVFASEDGHFRTNVGCQNASRRTVVINFELFDQHGSSLATEMMVLGPWANDQINRVFSDYRPMHGVVDVWSAVSSASFYCYGSILDNVTNDPTTIPPQ